MTLTEQIAAVLAEVAVAHQRMDSRTCLCGFDRLGASWAEHLASEQAAHLALLVRQAQAEALREALSVIADATTIADAVPDVRAFARAALTPTTETEDPR